ncbi:PRC-barrel domain-containing protein [Rhodomicrobium vannielii ATCC 17100]|uniref:PRC-barrel domain-containing protein n=1 Tax=Rhodomicrobium vannielii TaxID=1069 RepID=UPI001919DBC1|nr:PRC-barrel domain-containing protein [Rhodomicrobium vannielii]MBJ7535229.1 PRC-barrel domain-containing protein [Rhodomicrobium vannielii ATCC 17100]
MRSFCLVLFVVLATNAASHSARSSGSEARSGEPPHEQMKADQSPPERTVLWRAESVMGKNVMTRAGERAGRVVDVLADGSGAVQAAVVEVGGFLGVGSRRIAIAWPDLHFASDGRDVLVVELPRERLSEAPEVKTGKPVVAIGANSAKGRGAEGTN